MSFILIVIGISAGIGISMLYEHIVMQREIARFMNTPEMKQLKIDLARQDMEQLNG